MMLYFCNISGNRAAENIEMKPKTANGDLYKNNKNANNLRRPGDVGELSTNSNFIS